MVNEMDMTVFWTFVGCIIPLIIGIKYAKYYHRRVKGWGKIPTTKEYMKCLFIGWSSYMLILIYGCFAFFVLLVLITSILK